MLTSQNPYTLYASCSEKNSWLITGYFGSGFAAYEAGFNKANTDEFIRFLHKTNKAILQTPGQAKKSKSQSQIAVVLPKSISQHLELSILAV